MRWPESVMTRAAWGGVALVQVTLIALLGLAAWLYEATRHSADVCQEDKRGGPFETKARGASGILTGDFNYEVAEPIHARLQAPLPDGAPRYVDAWPIANPGKAHPPTAGVFDKVQWKGREFCCDFICVSEDLVPRVRRVAVDLQTAASDHQPVLLELGEGLET